MPDNGYATDSLPGGLPPPVVSGLQNWYRIPEHIRTTVEALLQSGVGYKPIWSTR